jgi:hypothetical protein
MSDPTLPRTIGKYGRHLGKSEIGARLALEPRLKNPFPYVSPESTFDGRCGVTALPDLGNLAYGCCVFVDYVYSRMLNAWKAGTQPVGNWSDYTVWPTMDQNLTAYFIYQGSPKPTDFVWSAENGYDNGCDQADAYLWFTMNEIGPLSKLLAFMQLPAGGQIYQGAMQVFGVVTDDIVVSAVMEDQFSAGEPWSDTALKTIVGGHSTASTYRDPKQGYTATWCVEWPYTWPNRRATLEEAYLILDEDQLHSQTYFDATELLEALAALQAEQGIAKGVGRRDAILKTKDRASIVQTPGFLAALKADAEALGEQVKTDAEGVAKTVEGDVKTIEADPTTVVTDAEADAAALVTQVGGDAVGVVETVETDAKDLLHDVEHLHDLERKKLAAGGVPVDDEGRPVGVPFER